MDTQNTPIHLRLWHREFWFLTFANFLLSASVYMMLIADACWLNNVRHCDALTLGCVIASYGIGLYIFGPYCSWLVGRYRRSAVCKNAILGISLIIAITCFLQTKYVSFSVPIFFFFLLRFVLGAFFGLAQMVISSTLVVDKCESFQRTEANHHAAWFSRFAMSIGPMFAVILLSFQKPFLSLININIESLTFNVYFVALVLSLLSIMLLEMVNFPFRAPDDNMKRFSLDRFFLPRGTLLFINLMLITSVVGIIYMIDMPAMFYAMMMVGFFLALLAEIFVFADADLKSEAITGLIVLGAAFLMMLTSQERVVAYLAPLFIGFGIGIIGSRFLLFFIKLSDHCQRGTSQSTFFLSWETGIAIGTFIGCLLHNDHRLSLEVGFLLIIVAFVLYNFFVHSWFLKHKNR